MQLYPAAMLKIIVPAALLAAALITRLYIDALGGDAQVLLAYLPYLMCVLSGVVSCLFNRVRFLLATLGVAVFYGFVQSRLQVSLSEPEAARAYLAVSVTLSLLTFYLLVAPERGIFSPYGAVVTLGFLALGALGLWLVPWIAQLNEAAASYYAPWPAGGYVLSRGASALAGFVVLVGVGLLLLRDEGTDSALLGAYLALLVALAQLHLAHISVVMCSAAGFCLCWGLLRSSHAMAYRDELTGLPGRRALNERLKMLGSVYTIAMLDIDHFKRFNDTHGHDVGDEVLRLVASRIRRVGAGGTAYRYGGEEFCVVFPRRRVADCEEAMEQVRRAIADYRMSLRDRQLRPVKTRDGSRRRGATRLGSSQVSVTISAGLAERTPEHDSAEEVIAAADRKLYQAKKAGRNRVAS